MRVKVLPVVLRFPSWFSKRHVWSSFLAKETANDSRIICDRFARHDNIKPLTLVNPIFNDFVGGCQGKIETTAQDVMFAENVAKAMQQHYSVTADRAMKLRELLQSYLGIAIRCKESQDGGSIYSTKRGLLCMQLQVKVERENGDTAIQNIGNYIYQQEFKRYSEEYEIPAFLVELEGPWLGVSAMLNVNGSIVHEHLSPQLPLSAPNHFRQTVLLCLASLKRAVLALVDFYEQDKLSKIPYFCLPFGCAPRSVQISRKTYRDCRGNVIKFVEGRYGENVHRFCAARGNAPPLLSCEPVSPNGIWWRIVIEEWALSEIDSAIDIDDARSQLKSLLDEMRANNFVHGNLRPENVYLYGSRQKITLVDFDWAGVAGVDVYPYEMNPRTIWRVSTTDWPVGARGGAKLNPDHDLEWFNRMF
ncbi:putative protein kinase-like domain superfamily [Plasmopara halstedii]